MPSKKRSKETKKQKNKPAVKRARKVKINVGKTELSPYTIYLTRDLPDPIRMVEDESLVTAANFVDYVSLLDDPVSLETAAGDLAISEIELLGQLKENNLIESKSLLERLLRMPRLPEIKIIRQKTEKPKDIFEDAAAVELTVSDETLNTPDNPDTLEPGFMFSFDESGEPTIIEQIEEELEELAEEAVEEVGIVARRWSFKLEHEWKQAIAAFVLLSFVFVLPLHAMNSYKNVKDQQNDLVASGQAALSELETAANSIKQADFNQAATSFTQAYNNFQAAEATLNEIDGALQALISLLPSTSKAYNTGVDLLKAGENLARAASRISDAFTAMQNEIDPNLISKIDLLEVALEKALPLLENAEQDLAHINIELLPEEAQDVVQQTIDQLPILTSSLNDFLSFSDMAKTILGEDKKQRYLVIFQNNTEIRPTGGFIGSYAEVDIYKGEIEKITVPAGGSYDLQGSLRDYVVAPGPLQLINARWEFQDANWFPDFPSSANKLIEFYQAAGGPSVDGVIAINATYVADLLSLLGPIQMENYNRTIDSENFVFETQKIVEIEADKTAPKQFLSDLTPKLVDRITESTAEGFLSILNHLNQGLTEKDVQLFFTDHQLEQVATELGWAGEIKGPAGDYIMVVSSNIGGGKTDAIISDEIDMQVNISEDGEITNTVNITRTHHGLDNELFTNQNNVDFLRLYVPRGSQLISAGDFEIPPIELFQRPQPYYNEDEDLAYSISNSFTDPKSGTIVSEEFGKTVFGNWVQTKPGETEVITFVYKLPWTLQSLSQEHDLVAGLKDWFGLHPSDEYTLFIQKQSGVIGRNINVTVNMPEALDIVWSNAVFENQTVRLSADETKDVFLGILMETDL